MSPLSFPYKAPGHSEGTVSHQLPSELDGLAVRTESSSPGLRCRTSGAPPLSSAQDLRCSPQSEAESSIPSVLQGRDFGNFPAAFTYSCGQ